MLDIPDKPYGKLDLISVDDHITEPGDVWTKRATGSMKDKAPKVVVTDDGTEMWQYAGKMVPNVGLSTMAGRTAEEYTAKAQNFKDMRPGCYDAAERVKDMDIDGVRTQICFPAVPGLGGESLMSIADTELRNWTISTYNDWLLEDFQGTAPGRLVGHAILPLTEPDKAVAELKRIGKMGVKSLTIPPFLDNVPGCKPIYHADYDPIWSLCEEMNIPINLHLSSRRPESANVLNNPMPGEAEAFITGAPVMGNFDFLALIIWTGMLHRHPKLQVISSEGGIGWIPYFLERSDYTYERHRYWTHSQLQMKPSEYFKRQCYGAFIYDEAGVALRHLIGVKNILWESDYPHTDTTWPFSHQRIDESLPGVPEDERRLIVFENTRRVFNLN
ncbi:MAG: amidohydrolase [Chloroflexi bacterium]|nr:amidohydrolase [Chloroflexota bacterium]